MSLDNVKVGDQVVTPNRAARYVGFPSVTHSVHVVDHVTATQFACGTRRFRKSDGRLLGSGPFGGRAELATPELLRQHDAEKAAEQRAYAARARISKLEAAINARRLSVEDMEAIATAFEATLAPAKVAEGAPQ